MNIPFYRFGVLSIIFILSITSISAQSNLSEILNSKDTKTFNEKVQEAEDYFLQKHPDKTPFELTEGEYRDGEYVKYRRWRHFWEARIEQNGKLADLGKHGKIYHQRKIEWRNDRFEHIDWYNISYDQDLGFQIGLGRTTSLAFHPTDENTFYVGAAVGGIWKTVDGGANYIPLGDDLPFMAVSAIAINQQNPEEIYIAIGDHVWYGPPSMGIYKSLDGGLTWNPTALNFDFEDGIQIYYMQVHPNNGKQVYVSTANGLYVTQDGFETIKKLENGSFVEVQFHPTNADIVYALSNNPHRLWKSENSGEDFERIQSFSGSGHPRMALTKANPDRISISAQNKLYTSLDQGATFTSITDQEEADTGNGITMISDLNENHIYTGFFDLYYSNDNGERYNKISDWLGRDGLPLVHVDYRNAFKNPLQPQYIYLCNDGGVYRIHAQTNQFENLSNGLIITQYYDIAVSQTDAAVMSGGSQDNGNVVMEDYSWDYAAPTADGMQQAIDTRNDFYKYNAIQLGSIYKFVGTDRSNISDKIANNKSGQGEWVTPFVLAHNNPYTIMAGYESVYHSSDRGETWQALGETLVNGRNLDLLAVAPSDDRKIYAVENWGISTGDHYGDGFTLSKIFEHLPASIGTWQTHVLPVSEPVRDIAVDPEDALHLVVSLSGYRVGHKVFESKDGGDSWKNISYNLPNAPATAIAIYRNDGEHIFVGTDAGMYYLDWSTSTWKIMGNFPHTYITDIEIVDQEQLIRVGTHGRGILEGNLADLSNIAEHQPSKLKECTLLSANPVHRELQLQLPIEGTTIEIYHTNGQFLHKTSQSTIDVSAYSAGIYHGIMKTKNNALLCQFRFVKM